MGVGLPGVKVNNTEEWEVDLELTSVVALGPSIVESVDEGT